VQTIGFLHPAIELLPSLFEDQLFTALQFPFETFDGQDQVVPVLAEDIGPHIGGAFGDTAHVFEPPAGQGDDRLGIFLFHDGIGQRVAQGMGHMGDESGMTVMLLGIHIEDFHAQIAEEFLGELSLFFSALLDVAENDDLSPIEVGLGGAGPELFGSCHRVGGDEVFADGGGNTLHDLLFRTAEIDDRAFFRDEGQ